MTSPKSDTRIQYFSRLAAQVIVGVLLTIVQSFTSSAATLTLDIEAYIDGRDQLIIQGNTLQWHHFDFAAVGRIGTQNDPTIISTTLDGSVVLDQLEWIPEWSAAPPDNIRQEELSSVFTGLDPAIIQPQSVLLEPLVARHEMTLLQSPSAANGNTTIVEFNDNPPGGADWYHARLIFELVPEPSSLLLAGCGICVVAVRRSSSLKIVHNTFEASGCSYVRRLANC